MEHAAADLATKRRITISTTTDLVHGGTSLKLSDGGPSPVLEAHPGSPVDISGRRRPSLPASLAPAHSYRSQAGLSRGEVSPSMSRMEMSIREDSVAVKQTSLMTEDGERGVERTPNPPRGMLTFYIPEKVPENERVSVTGAAVGGEDVSAVNAVMDGGLMDFEFDFNSVSQISANPLGHDSRTSLASTTTAISTSVNRRVSHDALTVDTSVASSATSMMSSADSTYSAVTSTTDMYGWEEELNRKSSVENPRAAELDISRRVASGGKRAGPSTEGSFHDPPYKRADIKRKSLLYRVLNLRRGSEDSCGPAHCATECPTTSA
jgi:hypothetical protein